MISPVKGPQIWYLLVRQNRIGCRLNLTFELSTKWMEMTNVDFSLPSIFISYQVDKPQEQGTPWQGSSTLTIETK